MIGLFCGSILPSFSVASIMSTPHLLFSFLLLAFSSKSQLASCVFGSLVHPQISHSATIIHLLTSAASFLAFSQLAALKNSFKTGEIALISQLIGTWTVKCFQMGFNGWPSFFLLCNAFPLLANFNFHSSRALSFLLWIIVCGFIALKENQIPRLFSEIFKNYALLLYWPLTLSLTFLATATILTNVSNNSRRKFYHFAAVALFLPAVFWSSSLGLLQVAFAFASTLFFQLELFRYSLNNRQQKQQSFTESQFTESLKQQSFTDSSKPQFTDSSKNYHFILDSLNTFMEKCRSDLDGGRMIFSHLYLLIGCAMPFWLSQKRDLSLFSGIISLGIGDSFASIGGKHLGTTNWHRKTKKTIEGSTCGFVAMAISWIVLSMYWTNSVAKASNVFPLILISAASAMWEALIDLNDNLTLPLFTFVLIKYSQLP
jgi:dolichol kinase